MVRFLSCETQSRSNPGGSGDKKRGIKMAREALLIVDMLNDFIDLYVEKDTRLKVPASRAIIPNIQKRIREARQQGMVIFYLCDAHDRNDKEFIKWPPHAIMGTKGAEIIEELEPHFPEDLTIVKKRYSGFFKTSLDRYLKSFKIKKIYITGILTNVCVLFTAVEASIRDYEVAIWADSVAALSKDDHETALDQMERVLKIKVIR